VPSSLRVLHVSRPLNGGVPIVVSRLVNDQVARGWQVAVACPSESDLREWTQRAGARWLAWPATRAPGPTTVDETRRLARILHDERADLIHLHASKAGLCGRLALRGRRPTLFQPHGWSFDMASGALACASGWWERLSAGWCDRVVCVSSGERLRGERAGVRARWEVVVNGVEVRPLGERAAARAALGIGPTTPLAVVVGRFCHEKGQDHLLRLWPQVRQRVFGAELALVGDGEDHTKVTALAREGIRFAGWTQDVRSWLVASNVVAMPSRSEAGSLVVLEALEAGRSAVASDVPFMRECIGESAGAIVAVEARQPLVDALALRLADPELADNEGVAGRRRVKEHFDVRVTNAAMAALYERVVVGD
jgi:glycosyltransferase involved in cell wall biosynthesis